VAFLEVPYALPPVRFENPQPLRDNYRYENKEYIYEASYCAQPKNDQLIAGTPYENIVGLGKPTENPLFVNVVCPPDFSPGSDRKYPVKIYIHGGFLQIGSPHEMNSQAQYIAAARSEVWVNIGYRVSALGFLACPWPKVEGNYGFKDQWLGLLWVRDNIDKFGGDPTNIQLTGLSAGGHSVQQILHHASRLPQGEQAPFQSAIIQSNGIMNNPKSRKELAPQFEAFCHAVGLEPYTFSIMRQLKDTDALPTSKITSVIESGQVGAEFDTFRATIDGVWLTNDPDPMTWQRSGGLARGLREKGVRSVIVGDLTEEWFVYGMTHRVHSYADVELNLRKYYPSDIVTRMLQCYERPENTPEALFKFMGKVLSDGQAHLPTRLLARDLINAGYPVLRYEIGWLPARVLRSGGYVSHGLDRVIWAYRKALLEQSEHPVVLGWLDAINAQRAAIEAGSSNEARNMKRVFALKDGCAGWKDDTRWDDIMRLTVALPGEN